MRPDVMLLEYGSGTGQKPATGSMELPYPMVFHTHSTNRMAALWALYTDPHIHVGVCVHACARVLSI